MRTLSLTAFPIASVLITSVLIFSMAACGGPSEQTGTGSDRSAESANPAGEQAPAGSPGEAGTVGDAPACVCKQGKAGTPIWCEACNKGYVDGELADCPLCVKKAQKKLEAAD